MMLDLSAVWCPPCNSAAACIAGDNAGCGGLFQGGVTPELTTMADNIRANLKNGVINWVTLLTDGAQQGQASTLADLQAWDSKYPQENVWVLGDDSRVVGQWLPTSGIPYFVSVNADFTYNNINTGAEWQDMANAT